MTKGAVIVALTSSTGSAVFGQPVTFVATVTATNPPSGSVTFFDGTRPLVTVPLDSTGKAALTTSNLAVGSRSITAAYGGNSDLSGQTPGMVTESVAHAGTRVVLVPHAVIKKKKVISLDLTATIAPLARSEGIPAGTVRFMINKKKLGTATIHGGQATLKVKASSVLNRVVTITYSGDPNFLASSATPKLTQKSLKTLARTAQIL